MSPRCHLVGSAIGRGLEGCAANDLQGLERSDLAFCKQPAHCLVDRRSAGRLVHHKGNARLFALLDQGASNATVSGDRPVAEDMFAGFCRRRDIVFSPLTDGADVDEVYERIAQRLSPSTDVFGILRSSEKNRAYSLLRLTTQSGA
uniref:hypothetical protein n=1 Tax=Rhizobium sp. RCAM05350 TaxID=2895568 RepID=UPI0020769FFD|nr:hypothetical protein [Rhizobium sp. RCAM05350]